MKTDALKLANPVVSSRFLLLVFFFALQGCNEGSPTKQSVPPTQPTAPSLSYRYCSDKDLIQLPNENEKLVAGIYDEADGWYVYRYIYEYSMNVFYNLPKAARKLNQGFQIRANCGEIFSCEMESGSKDKRLEDTDLMKNCREGGKIVRNYISKLSVYSHSEDSLNLKIEEACPDAVYKSYNGEGSSRKHIQEVLIKGIPMIPTIEDLNQRTIFKEDLAKLCKVYRETDYCSRNLQEIHDLCETITK